MNETEGIHFMTALKTAINAASSNERECRQRLDAFLRSKNYTSPEAMRLIRELREAHQSKLALYHLLETERGKAEGKLIEKSQGDTKPPED